LEESIGTTTKTTLRSAVTNVGRGKCFEEVTISVRWEEQSM
jgi:hypothetical protein